MTAKELKRIFQKGECLSLDTMRLYSQGKLNKKSMHEVEKHLIECSLCSTAMDGLTGKRLDEVNKVSSRIQRRLAVYMNTPPRISFFRRFGFAIGSAVLLLMGGTTTVIIIHKKSSANIIAENIPAKSVQYSVTQNAGQVSASDNPSTVASTVIQNDNSSASGVVVTSTSAEKKNQIPDLPATLPGKQVSLPLSQADHSQSTSASQASLTNDQPPSSGASTRNSSSTSNENIPLRIKNVTIYPPVTHDDNPKHNSSSNNGQLSRSSRSSADFQLDQMPTYSGGDEALRGYILSSFHPMKVDRSQITQYATGVMFIVNSKTGEISAPQLSLTISPEVDAEILRVIQSMPQWNPGKKRGAVDVMIGITLE